MSKSGIKIGSMNRFANSIKDTIKPNAKGNIPLPEEKKGEENAQKETQATQQEEVTVKIESQITDKKDTPEVKEELSGEASEKNKQGREASKKKKKAGRKKEFGEIKKILIGIPKDLVDQIEIAASIVHKGNISSYVRSLILKDLKENKKHYDAINEIMRQTQR